MMNLFSSFDAFHFNFSFLSFLYLSFLLFVSFSYLFNLVNFIFFQIFKFFINFYSNLKPNSFTKMLFLFFMSLFMFYILINFFSIFSFFFPSCSQISLVLFFSLSFWFSFIFFSLAKSFKNLMAHFIPLGTPLILSFFLFVIEIISNFIRPLTLSIRLVANILAGHLLMILLSQTCYFFYFSFFIYILLNLVEIIVSFIQSYIYVTMVCLYFSDIC